MGTGSKIRCGRFMSELKNSFHTELGIMILLNDEKNMESKLDVLTAISLATKNKETVEICERIRERICSEEVPEKRKNLVRSPKNKRIYKVNPREKESHEMDGAE